MLPKSAQLGQDPGETSQKLTTKAIAISWWVSKSKLANVKA